MQAEKCKVPGIGLIQSMRLYRRYKRDYVHVYRHLHDQFGDIFSLYLPGKRFVICEKDAVSRCLKRQNSLFIKSADYRRMRPLLGLGLLTSDGDLWHAERKTYSPHFGHSQLARFHRSISRRVLELINQWKSNARHPEPINVSSDMTYITVVVAGDLFFGEDLGDDAPAVRESIQVLTEELAKRIVSIVNFPLYVPTRSNLRFRSAIRTIDGIVYRMIERRRRNYKGDDVISSVIRAAAENGTELNEIILRDEIVTLLSAGHETTALALAWVLALISRRPEIQRSMREEVRNVVGHEVISYERVAELKYTLAVIKETLRLYPPIPAVSRQLKEAIVINGYEFPKGSLLTFPAGVCQKDDRWWPNPEEFDPGRFLGAERVDDAAFFPFGLGPRRCIGEGLAYLEMVTIIASIVSEFNVESFGPIPEQIAQVTLRPRVPIRLRFRPEVAANGA